MTTPVHKTIEAVFPRTLRRLATKTNAGSRGVAVSPTYGHIHPALWPTRTALQLARYRL
ncbi:hypothetical protein LCGC14_0769550 [marine sediment metagenome]|uniref:Uncharacterized protein n=1 Tax=marine sediment metagenome TaxID=412755 RepID=A0A0F9T5P0_9ZZZZ